MRRLARLHYVPAARPARMASPSPRATAPSAGSPGLSSPGLPSPASGGPAPADVEAVVRAVHAAPARAVVYATGGGAQAISWLLTVPGASATLLEARVPYGGRRAWAAAVGAAGVPPGSLASAAGAAALAAAAYRHAATLAEFGDAVVGVGLTAALATDRERRGDDRIHVACDDGRRRREAAISLPRGSHRDRGAQDGLASRLLLRTLAAAVGVGGPPLALGLAAGERVAESVDDHTPDPVAALLAGTVACVEFGPTPATPPIVGAPRGAGRLYLPGSFNPLHGGHAAGLAAAAAAAAAAAPPGAPPPAPAYELSIVNADKGALGAGDVRARVAQFTARGASVVLTRAPLLCDKAALLGPGAAFVVGVDTADRLVDPKYYAGGAAGAAAALARVAAGGGKVYVLGRATPAGAFRTLADVDVPPAIAALNLFVGVDGFREDVSSTELRAAGKGL